MAPERADGGEDDISVGYVLCCCLVTTDASVRTNVIGDPVWRGYKFPAIAIDI